MPVRVTARGRRRWRGPPPARPARQSSQPAHKAVARNLRKSKGYARRLAAICPQRASARCTEGEHTDGSPGERAPAACPDLLSVSVSASVSLDVDGSRLAGSGSGAGLSTKGILNLPAISAAAVTAPRGIQLGDDEICFCKQAAY